MDINHNLVNGCPLCEIFINPEKYIKTKVYYPEIDKINTSEFVILDCKTCKVPMAVVRDHTTNVSKELWGKVLYECKNQFGYNIQLRCKPRKIFDHFHCHVIEKKRY